MGGLSTLSEGVTRAGMNPSRRSRSKNKDKTSDKVIDEELEILTEDETLSDEDIDNYYNQENDEQEDDDDEVDFSDDNEEEDDDDDYESAPVPSIDQIKKNNQRHEFDIFEDFGERHAKADDILKYMIFQNGHLAATKFHPYSWEQIQQEFGGGSFKVVARSTVSGKIVKNQSKSVAAPIKGKSETESSSAMLKLIENMQKASSEERERLKTETERRERENMKAMQQLQEKMSQESKESNDKMMTMLIAMMNKPQDNSHKDMMAAMMQQQQQSQQQLMTLLLPLLTKKDDGGLTQMMTMMMEMQQNSQSQTMALFEKFNSTSSSTLEKFSEKLEKIKNSDEGLTGFKLLELYKDAQGAGFEQYKMLQKLAEEKAESSGGNDDSEDSLTKTLIKQAIPALGAFANLAKNDPTAQAAPIQNPNRSLPRPQRNPQRPPQQRTRPNPNAKQNPRQNAQGRPNEQAGRTSRRQNNQENDLVYAPPRPVSKVAQVSNNKQAPVNTKESTITPNPAIDSKPNNGKIEAEIKAKAIESLTPVIVEYMTLGKDPVETAQASIVKLLEEKLDAKKVVQVFSVDALIELAAGYGLTEAEVNGLNTWIKGYYDSMVKIVSERL